MTETTAAPAPGTFPARCATPCPRPPIVPAGTLAVHKQWDDLAAGDRVQTWDGINATVVDVELHLTRIHDGSLVAFEATLTLHSAWLPTFDGWGWPKHYEGHIRRRVRKHSEDLRHHTAGRA